MLTHWGLNEIAKYNLLPSWKHKMGKSVSLNVISRSTFSSSSHLFVGSLLMPIFDSVQSFPGDSDGKQSACNAGDPGSIPGLGRSPAEGNDNPLQYSCLENPMDRGAWWATVHRVAKSQT